jgi:hypothetical protein
MRQIIRTIAAAALLGNSITVAQAQIFWSPPALAAANTAAIDLAGARAEEQKAALVWHLRAALNVAALQCDFEPTLLTVSNYNAMIAHHKSELASGFSTLGSYFARTVGAGKPGQTALDQYGTRVYSSYSAGQAQKAFCHMAGIIGREAIFTPRGQFATLATKRVPDLRRALAGGSEQQFTNPAYAYRANLPSFTKKCWGGDYLKADCAAKWTASLKN